MKDIVAVTLGQKAVESKQALNEFVGYCVSSAGSMMKNPSAMKEGTQTCAASHSLFGYSYIVSLHHRACGRTIICPKLPPMGENRTVFLRLLPVKSSLDCSIVLACLFLSYFFSPFHCGTLHAPLFFDEPPLDSLSLSPAQVSLITHLTEHKAEM